MKKKLKILGEAYAYHWNNRMGFSESGVIFSAERCYRAQLWKRIMISILAAHIFWALFCISKLRDSSMDNDMLFTIGLLWGVFFLIFNLYHSRKDWDLMFSQNAADLAKEWSLERKIIKEIPYINKVSDKWVPLTRFLGLELKRLFSEINEVETNPDLMALVEREKYRSLTTLMRRIGLKTVSLDERLRYKNSHT